MDEGKPWTGTTWPLTDAEFVQAWKELEEAALQAFAAREKEMVLRWDPKKVMALCEEVLNRRPRNISYLMKDDFIDRAESLLDRMTEEVAFMISVGPSETVSERFAPDRKRYFPASKELKANLQSRKEP